MSPTIESLRAQFHVAEYGPNTLIPHMSANDAMKRCSADDGDLY